MVIKDYTSQLIAFPTHQRATFHMFAMAGMICTTIRMIKKIPKVTEDDRSMVQMRLGGEQVTAKRVEKSDMAIKQMKMYSMIFWNEKPSSVRQIPVINAVANPYNSLELLISTKRIDGKNRIKTPSSRITTKKYSKGE